MPERVKFQLAGSQLELSASVNRLLDQFHIPDIEVADLNTPNPDLLGVGLGWTQDGAYALLLGAIVGLPGDPIAVRIYWRTAKARCRGCGECRPVSRAALFCPHCGACALPKHVRLCPHCETQVQRGDTYCVACGLALDGSPASC